MIAARLAGGNLFFCLFLVGDFFERSERSEHSDFFEGIFFGGVVGCVLD